MSLNFLIGKSHSSNIFLKLTFWICLYFILKENELHKVDHEKLKATNINFKKKGKNDFVKATSKAPILIGNTQYPRTHTD